MSFNLPSMAYADRIRERATLKFGGYNHRLGAGEGELFFSKNLTSSHYPYLAPRDGRYLISTLTKPNGLYCHDALYYVDGTGFFKDGVLKGVVSDTKKVFASLGAYIVIFPDKKYYDTVNDSFGDMEASFSGSVTFKDGTYADELAEANTLRAVGANFSELFKVGDALTISGCNIHKENNVTLVVREISENELRFYENSFTLDDSEYSEASVTIKREVPDLDYICVNENRLFGCRGDTIYASKLGDIFNFNVFDGLSTDSYAVNVGSAGDFTGCVSYLGYPIFFKEEHIYKLYGNRPDNFQVMGSASLGVESGSGGSLAIAGEVLFYLSKSGIVAYSGGIPQNISEVFGDKRYKNAVGGSDGKKYYVSMEDMEGNWHIFVYDSYRRIWQREDELSVISFGYFGDLYFLSREGKLWLNGNPRKIPEGAEYEGDFESIARFVDFTERSTHKKGITKLQVHMSLEAGASARIEIQYDSDGVWHELKTLNASVMRSFYLPVIPRRCDHFAIRIIGRGKWVLSSLVREFSDASKL